MKRFILGLILLLGFSLNAEAGLISIQTLSNDSQISYTYFNTAMNTIKNEFNGNIESANIKDGTIAIADMATAASPAQREGDHFNAYTKSGMLPATSTAPDLFSDISAGVSYVKSDAGLLYRVATDATAKTYTATKDTWVYIDINGAFQYEVLTNGAAQPTTPANSLILAKVVTDGDNITSVTDYRTLAISLGGSDDFYIKGLGLLWDLATDRMSADTGVVYVGTTRIAKVARTGLNVGTASDYINGASERAVSTWIYVYVNDEGSIKLDNNAPDYHDTDGNTTGIKYYFKNGTDYWRIIAEVRLNATGSGNIGGFYESGDGRDVMHNIPINITTTVSAAAWSAATSCATAMPSTSTMGIFGMHVAQTTGGGADAGVWIRPNGSTWAASGGGVATGAENGIYIQAGDTPNQAIGGQRWCMTDTSQRIQYYNEDTTDEQDIDVEGYIRNYR